MTNLSAQAAAKRDASNSLADYHLTEIVEGLIPDVEFVNNGTKDDIRRRLIDVYLEGYDLAKQEAQLDGYTGRRHGLLQR